MIIQINNIIHDDSVLHSIFEPAAFQTEENDKKPKSKLRRTKVSKVQKNESSENQNGIEAHANKDPILQTKGKKKNEKYALEGTISELSKIDRNKV